MKILKVEQDGTLFRMTKKPCLLKRLFGAKNIIEIYRTKYEVYERFPHLYVFYKSTGEILRCIDEECRALNNYVNRI